MAEPRSNCFFEEAAEADQSVANVAVSHGREPKARGFSVAVVGDGRHPRGFSAFPRGGDFSELMAEADGPFEDEVDRILRWRSLSNSTGGIVVDGFAVGGKCRNSDVGASGWSTCLNKR